MKRPLITILILSTIIPGCHAQTPQTTTDVTFTQLAIATSAPLSTETPSIPDTHIDGNNLTLFAEPCIPHRTIKDVTGGYFINIFSGSTEPTEPVSLYDLDHFPVRVARVRMTLESFHDTEYNHATFQLMQELQARGTEIVVTSLDLSDWLMADPGKDTKRFLPSGRYPEVVEIIVAWLIKAREEYGVKPQYISFNEPDVGAYITIAPVEAAIFIEQAGKRFNELGIKTKWLITDPANISSSVRYAR